MEEHHSDEQKTRSQLLRERLNNTYRLVVMNDETFEEVRSLKLTLLNVYVLVSSILVVVAVAVFLMIAYTPLKQYLPGYGDVVEKEELAILYQAIDGLELELAAQKVYADTFRSLLMGQYQSVEEAQEQLDSIEVHDHNHSHGEAEEVTLSAEEIQLRRELELDAIGQTARQGQGMPTAGSQVVPLEQMFFVPPIQGEISGQFEPEKKHNGVDIIAPKGTAVKSTMDGHVILSDFTYDTGYTIGIQHKNGVVSFYKHNSELLKEIGSYVKAGEAVAIIGNTGHQTTGPHLHFELWYNGVPVNCTQYIRF